MGSPALEYGSSLTSMDTLLTSSGHSFLVANVEKATLLFLHHRAALWLHAMRKVASGTKY